MLEQLKKHSSVHSRNLTNGIVNAFQRYFSAIINAAALKRPEMLSSSQTVRVDDVLRFTRHKDLVAFIIDRKINELSYGGLADMEKYFDDRLGVRMFDDNRQRELLCLFVEVRNINVHNGGIVNDLFASRVGTVKASPTPRARPFTSIWTRLSRCLKTPCALRCTSTQLSVLSSAFNGRRIEGGKARRGNRQ